MATVLTFPPALYAEAHFLSEVALRLLAQKNNAYRAMIEAEEGGDPHQIAVARAFHTCQAEALDAWQQHAEVLRREAFAISIGRPDLHPLSSDWDFDEALIAAYEGSL